MKSIKKLNQKLQKIEKLEEQMKNFKSVGEIPIALFLMCKDVTRKKSKIYKEIEQIKRFAKGSKLLYEYEINCWIENPSINRRQYQKLKARAKYRRDCKLYRCGFIDQRPIIPFFQKIQSKLKKINPLNNIFFKTIHDKIINYNSNILPKKINKLAVNSAKLCINGYRKFKLDCNCVKTYVLSKDSIKYIRNVFKHASNQLEYSNAIQKNPTKKGESDSKSYREALKVQSNGNISTYKKENNNKNVAVNGKNLAMEYELM